MVQKNLSFFLANQHEICQEEMVYKYLAAQGFYRSGEDCGEALWLFPAVC